MNGWMVTGAGLPRTGESDLTDDELIICDAIFNVPALAGLLASDDFGLIFNTPYKPSVDRSGLRALLTSMRDRGLIVADGPPVDRFIGLTATGGALWEQERRPVWPAYCSDSRSGVEGTDVLRIVASRRDVAEAFLNVSADAGLYTPMSGPVEISEAVGPIVSWKTDTVVTMKVPIFVDQLVRTSWSRFESQRTFWRTINELLQSHRVVEDRLGLPLPPPLPGGAA